MLIQAYNRAKTHTANFNGGVNFVFKPNAKGDVVCDVEDGEFADRLLAIATGYRAYEAAEPVMASIVAPVLTATPVVAPIPPIEGPINGTPPAADDTESPFVLVSKDGAKLDLRPMTDVQLREFGKANGVKLHHLSRGDTLRAKIVGALAVAPE